MSKQFKEQKAMKERITSLLELPKDVVLGLPSIHIEGNKEIHIENIKGLIGYTDNNIKIRTKIGFVTIKGEQLLVKSITSEEIIVIGIINKLEFK